MTMEPEKAARDLCCCRCCGSPLISPCGQGQEIATALERMRAETCAEIFEHFDKSDGGYWTASTLLAFAREEWGIDLLGDTLEEAGGNVEIPPQLPPLTDGDGHAIDGTGLEAWVRVRFPNGAVETFPATVGDDGTIHWEPPFGRFECQVEIMVADLKHSGPIHFWVGDDD